MSKPRRRNWTLSPRDLPDPRLIKDEPLLQDLENNATYRMLIFRRKALSSGADPALAGCLILITLPLLFSGQMWLVVTTAVIVLVALLWAGRGSLQNPAENFLFGVDRERFKDLLSAGVSRVDMSHALWAYHLPSGKRYWFYQLMPIFLLVPMIIVLFLVNDPTRWMLTPFITWPAAEAAKRRYLPYTLLPYVAEQTERCYSIAKVGVLARSTGCSWALWSVAMMIIGSLILIFAVIDNIQGNRTKIEPAVLDILFGPYVPTIAAISFGLLIGIVLGNGSKKDRDEWLAQTRKWLRNLSDEIARADDEV